LYYDDSNEGIDSENNVYGSMKPSWLSSPHQVPPSYGPGRKRGRQQYWTILPRHGLPLHGTQFYRHDTLQTATPASSHSKSGMFQHNRKHEPVPPWSRVRDLPPALFPAIV